MAEAVTARCPSSNRPRPSRRSGTSQRSNPRSSSGSGKLLADPSRRQQHFDDFQRFETANPHYVMTTLRIPREVEAAETHPPSRITFIRSISARRSGNVRGRVDFIDAKQQVRRFGGPVGGLGNAAGATILRTVIRVRAVDQDPTVLGLVRVATEGHRRAWQTVDAAQAAVRVASGHRLYWRADELCRWVDDALLTGIDLPAGRVRKVEDAEFRLWNLHQRTGPSAGSSTTAQAQIPIFPGRSPSLTASEPCSTRCST